MPMILAWPVLALTVGLSAIVVYMTIVADIPIEPSYTLRHWARLTEPFFYSRVLPNTLMLGLGTVVLTTLFATSLAWFCVRTTMPWQRTFITLIALVGIVPGFVKAMGWLLLFGGQIGLGNRLLVDTFSLPGPPIDFTTGVGGSVWVMALTLTPTMFFLLAGPMRMLDPALEEAALVSGASRRRAVLRISMPLMLPAILGGAIYTFMTSISVFEIPALLVGSGGQYPVLATELFYAVSGEGLSLPAYGAAGVYGTVIFLPSLVALYFYLKFIEQGHRYAVITGKGYRPQRVDLGRFTWIAVAFVAAYVLAGFGLPALVLVWMSLLPTLRMPSAEALSLVTLQNYLTVPSVIGWKVIWNTLTLIVATAVLTVLCSFMVSWVVVRTRFRIRKAMDVLALLPHAIPGVALAFALLMIAILMSVWAPLVPLRGTIGIVVIANVVNRLAYASRITNAALLQVNKDLEDAASVSGAGVVSTMRRIVAPLVAPSLLFAALWTAVQTFREVSIPLMLSGPDNLVLATRTWILWRQGETAEAAALSVVMIVTLGLLALSVQFLVGSRSDQPRAAREAPNEASAS